MAEQQSSAFVQAARESISDSIYVPITHTLPLNGVAPDLTLVVAEKEYLASAINFLIRDGYIKRRDGYTTRVGVDSTATVAMHTITEWTPYDGSARVVMATPTRFYYYSPDTWNDITTTARAGILADPIFFTPMRTSNNAIRLVSVNGTDPPCWWSGATNSAFVVLSTAVIGTCVTVWRSHLLQGDTTDTADGKVSSRVHWSALGDPTVWTGTASAGSLDLIDANASKVMVFQPLRNTLLAYKSEAVHSLTYRASPLYFTQNVLHGSLTLFAARCVAPVNGGEQHFVFTQEGAILWDGQGIKAIGRNRVDQTIFRAISWADRKRTWTYYSPNTREVFLSLPAANGVDHLWVYHLDTDSWWETDLDILGMYTVVQATSSAFTSPAVLCGASDSVAVYQLFTGASDSTASAAISSSFQTGYYNYGAVEHKGIFKMGLIGSPGSGTSATVSLSKAGTENPLILPTFADAQTLTLTGGNHFPKIDFRLTDRWISYRLTHSGAGESLTVSELIPSLTQRSDARKRR